MSLLDDWLNQGHRAADKALSEHGEETVTDLLRKLTDEVPPPSADAHIATVRGFALEGIEKLRKNTPALVGMTRKGLTVVMAYLASADDASALKAYLRTKAGPNDLVAASLAASTATVEERDRRDATIEGWKALGLKLLQDIGPIAARYLLPLLLKAL